MSKILEHLNKQMQTENKADALEVMEVYNFLKSIDGSVWSMQWDVLVTTIFPKPFNRQRIYQLNEIGKAVLKGLKN